MNSLAASTNGQSSNGNKADGGGDNAEENGGVMNNIMSDIQNGFVHRRLPDGGFKVCRLKKVYTPSRGKIICDNNMRALVFT